MLRSLKILSVASSGIEFDGTSATHRHFVTLCLSVYVSTLVYPAGKQVRRKPSFLDCEVVLHCALHCGELKRCISIDIWMTQSILAVNEKSTYECNELL
jgi:hypothetical protein